MPMKCKIIPCDLDGVLSSILKIETDTLLFVIDSKVYALYEQEISSISEKQKKGKRVIIWKSSEGEKTKNFSDFQSCVEFFLEKGVHRNCHLVAIGGGATTDFGGFVAATLLRGIKWTSVPTTLLGMIDAGLGGKTGINSKSGKNLVGAFHMPENVFINPSFLNTLSEPELLSGIGEMIKYSFLSLPIFESLIKGRDYKEQIISCALFKQQVVEEDFLESKKRKYLNLGHTFGHGIERIYNLPHGVSVVWGMAIVFKMIQKEQFLSDLIKLLDILKWENVDPPWHNKSFPSKDLFEYITKDKKRTSNISIDLILLEKIGSAKIESFFLDELEKKLDNYESKFKTFNLRSENYVVF